MIGSQMVPAKQQLEEKMISEEAEDHLIFMAEVYKWQAKEGKHFVHEIPVKSVAWDWESMKEVLALEEVSTVTCASKRLSNGQGMDIVKLVSNSPCVVQEMGRTCYGQPSPLNGGMAVVYPHQTVGCDSILRNRLTLS